MQKNQQWPISGRWRVFYALHTIIMWTLVYTVLHYLLQMFSKYLRRDMSQKRSDTSMIKSILS